MSRLDTKPVADAVSSPQEAGTRLEFDAMGRMKSQCTAARAPGTTVVLKELFKPLAVRHKARPWRQTHIQLSLLTLLSLCVHTLRTSNSCAT